jgi:hypothetical protein
VVHQSFFSFLFYVLHQNFFRISPGFCFADGLASLALLRQGMKDKTSDGVYDWNVTGASICYLAIEVFFSSNFADIEFFIIDILTFEVEYCKDMKMVFEK